MSENLSYLAKKSGLKETIKDKINNNSLIGAAAVTGANSFYDFLNQDNQKVKIRVCNGTACQVSNKQNDIKADVLKRHNDKNIGSVNCLGHCYINTAYMDGENVLTAPDDILYAESLNSSPILIGDTLETSKIKKVMKRSLLVSPDDLLFEIEKSKIRGRGGAGFPMALKLKSCKEQQSAIKYIICNADEGDPGSFSDKYLLESRPDLVLFGMVIAARVIGAQTGVIYIRAEYPKAVDIINKTIEEWKAEGLLGENVLGTGFSVNLITAKGAGSYICGEETALLSSLEGQRAEVRVRPPYPTISGLFNQPTTISNVETLANLYSIVSDGGDKYARLGTKDSTGVKLVSLNGLFSRPGVYEVEMGEKLSTFTRKIGFNTKVKALQVGGPLGGVVPISMDDHLTVDFESFKNSGFLLGHAGMLAIPEDFPMIKFIEHLLEFTSDESCGKCVPCRVGATRGFELVKKSSQKKIDRNLFSDLLEIMELGSCCALGGGISLPVRNILKFFSSELQNFFEAE